MPREHSLLSVLPAPLPSPRYSGQRYSQEPDWRVPKQRARLVRRLPSRSAGEAGAQRPRCWRCLGSAASQGSLGTRAGQGPHGDSSCSNGEGGGRRKGKERAAGIGGRASRAKLQRAGRGGSAAYAGAALAPSGGGAVKAREPLRKNHPR